MCIAPIDRLQVAFNVKVIHGRAARTRLRDLVWSMIDQPYLDQICSGYTRVWQHAKNRLLPFPGTTLPQKPAELET